MTILWPKKSKKSTCAPFASTKSCSHAGLGSDGCRTAVPHYLPAGATTKTMPALPTRVAELADLSWHVSLVLRQVHSKRSQRFSAQNRLGYFHRVSNRSDFRPGPPNHPLAGASRDRTNRFEHLSLIDLPPHRRMNRRSIKITRANAGGPPRLATRKCWAARIALSFGGIG